MILSYMYYRASRCIWYVFVGLFIVAAHCSASRCLRYEVVGLFISGCAGLGEPITNVASNKADRDYMH